ncbi:hypothetical protein GCM10007962_06760 [Yeosuana aromativorans]|uniref:Uncharacterized protein n=1 Tax=Yeosuana aromativorans TaxID=288019 RepID=A0A8J3BE47_9FLAO|nr:hypothetical protein GCM10007962_06760 [Yeosuana aromativorans]
MDILLSEFKYTPKEIKSKIIKETLFNPKIKTSAPSGTITLKILQVVYKKYRLIRKTTIK